MKVKKESIILVVVIVAISVYLMTRKSDRTHYELPNLTPVKMSALSKMEITKGDGTIILSKGEDDQWKILPKGYPADASKIDGLLDAIGNLTVTALISESESYSRYELDEGSKIGVKAWAGSHVKREFDVGKPASSFQHTFIKLMGDKRVYHGRGNFKSRFDQTVDGLRDKAVLSFETDEINDITISKERLVQTFSRVQIQKEPTPAGSGSEPPEPEKTVTVWKTPDGEKGDEAEIKKLLNALSDLSCDQFIDNQKKDDLKEPVHTIQLKGGQTYNLSLFSKKDDEKKVPAVSSGSDYPFLLPEWQVNNLTKIMDNLVREPQTGVEKK